MAKIIFLFPGQGSQSVGMGKDLYEKFDCVKKIFEDGNKILGFDIKKYCFEGPIEELTKTDVVQPAITLVNLSVLAVLKENGISPDAICGHSLGEYSALFAAGVLDFNSVIKLVQLRGRYMQEAADKNPGSMIAVIGLSPEKVKDICAAAAGEGVVGIANINTKEQLIVSGSTKAVEKVSEIAGKEGAKVIPLKVSGPWHSALIKEAQERMSKELAARRFSAPKIPVICNVTADFAKSPDEIKNNLVRQITGSVRWLETVERLNNDYKDAVYVEAGPGRVLRGLARSINRELEVYNVENSVTLDSLKKAMAEKVEKR